KKKPAGTGGGLSGMHIGLIVGGIAVLLLGTVAIFFIQRRVANPRPKGDPQQVLAELQEVHAMVKRDETRPDKPVIGVDFTGQEFKFALIEKLAVFPELQELSLANTKFADVHADYLETLTTLRKLNLGFTKLTDGGMPPLAKLVNLEEVHLN